MQMTQSTWTAVRHHCTPGDNADWTVQKGSKQVPEGQLTLGSITEAQETQSQFTL